MVWIESKPTNLDPLSEFPSVMTAQAIAFRTNIEKHSFWTDSSGASAGDMRLSDGSFGPGSARAFFDVESNVSSTLSATKPLAGRLYITSDTSRFYAYSSGNSALLGGNNIIVWQPSAATAAAGSRVLVQVGTLSGQTAGAVIGLSGNTIAFPIAYSVTPSVQVQEFSGGTTDLFSSAVTKSTATNFVARVSRVWGSQSTTTIVWRSIGTVVL
jgi:hypothetical protein